MDNVGVEFVKTHSSAELFWGAGADLKRDAERSLKLREFIIERLLMWDLHSSLMKDVLEKKHGKDKQYFEFVNKRFGENPWVSFLPANSFIGFSVLNEKKDERLAQNAQYFGAFADTNSKLRNTVIQEGLGDEWDIDLKNKQTESGTINESENVDDTLNWFSGLKFNVFNKNINLGQEGASLLNEPLLKVEHYKQIMFNVIEVFVKNNKDYCSGHGVDEALLQSLYSEPSGLKESASSKSHTDDVSGKLGLTKREIDADKLKEVMSRLLGEYRVKSYALLGEHFVNKNSVRFWAGNYLASIMINDLSDSEWNCALGLNEPKILLTMLVGEQNVKEVLGGSFRFVRVCALRAVRQQQRFINLMQGLRLSNLSTTLQNSSDKFWAFRQKIKERKEKKKTYFKRTNFYFDVNMSSYMSQCLVLRKEKLKKETKKDPGAQFEIVLGEALLEAIDYKKKMTKHTLITSGLLASNGLITPLIKGATGSEHAVSVVMGALVLFSSFNLYKLFESKNTPIQNLYKLVLEKFNIKSAEIFNCLNQSEDIKELFFTNLDEEQKLKELYKEKDTKKTKINNWDVLGLNAALALKSHVLKLNNKAQKSDVLENDLFCDRLYSNIIYTLNKASNSVSNSSGRLNAAQVFGSDDSNESDLNSLTSICFEKIKNIYNKVATDSKKSNSLGYASSYDLGVNVPDSANKMIGHLFSLNVDDYFKVKEYLKEIQLLKVVTNKESQGNNFRTNVGNKNFNEVQVDGSLKKKTKSL